LFAFSSSMNFAMSLSNTAPFSASCSPENKPSYNIYDREQLTDGGGMFGFAVLLDSAILFLFGLSTLLRT
jgi:hypothetical protein